MGAIAIGAPYNKMLFLSHASLYAPSKTSKSYVDMGSHIGELRKLALEGHYKEAGDG